MCIPSTMQSRVIHGPGHRHWCCPFIATPPAPPCPLSPTHMHTHLTSTPPAPPLYARIPTTETRRTRLSQARTKRVSLVIHGRDVMVVAHGGCAGALPRIGHGFHAPPSPSLRRCPQGGWMEEGQSRRTGFERPEHAGTAQARRCRHQEARLCGLGDCECGGGGGYRRRCADDGGRSAAPAGITVPWHGSSS